ncbi:MAG: ActS/PrrB/RegB family redox-sensitive histidine kinase [Hyphomicrobiaceae bacterium]
MKQPQRTRPDVLNSSDFSRLRVETSVRLRWFAVAGQLLTVLFVAFVLEFEVLLWACLALIAMSAWLNVYLRWRFPPAYRLNPLPTTLLFGYDLIQLGALLTLTGGLTNPFVVLIVAPVTVSAATLPARSTVLLGALALAITGFMSIVYVPLPWAADDPFSLPWLYKLGSFAAVTACLVFLTLYAWRLSKEARQMSSALAATEVVLAREQQLHALDGLAAAAAHELGTPLATIVLVASELQSEASDNPALTEDLALLKSQAERCRDILRKLTRDPSGPDPMHARMTLRQIAEEVTRPHRRPDVAVRVEVDRDTATDADEPEADRRPGVLYGLGNLIENAVDFAHSVVVVKVGWDADAVWIEIRDDGPGFPAGILDQIGDPYLSSTPPRKLTPDRLIRPSNGARRAGGLGLGLFIAKTLLERSGATFDAGNSGPSDAGAVVKLVWSRESFTVTNLPSLLKQEVLPPFQRSSVAPGTS